MPQSSPLTPFYRKRRLKRIINFYLKGWFNYAANWHLIVYCRLRRDFRDFRLDRVTELEVLDETYAGQDGFSVETMAGWDT